MFINTEIMEHEGNQVMADSQDYCEECGGFISHKHYYTTRELSNGEIIDIEESWDECDNCGKVVLE